MSNFDHLDIFLLALTVLAVSPKKGQLALTRKWGNIAST